MIDHRATSFAREGQRRRYTFARGRGNRERNVAFSANTQGRKRRSVLDVQSRVHDASHARHIANVGRVNDGRVAEAVFVVLRFVDGLIHITTTNEGNEGHHLFDGNEGIRFVGFTKQKLDVVRNFAVRPLGQAVAGPGRDSPLAGTSCRSAPSPTCVMAAAVRRSTSLAVRRTAPAFSIACMS